MPWTFTLEGPHRSASADKVHARGPSVPIKLSTSFRPVWP